MTSVRRALLSVSDKRGIVELARTLSGRGVEILSTGGTARVLTEAGVEVKQVAEHTGFPEILDGRVKTLHPRIHGGILGRDTEEHVAQMRAMGIEPIDLVVVNLYPFAQTVARPGVTREEAVEQIDIGGPSMIRSAAKNHERVTVLVDPEDYPSVAAEVGEQGGVADVTRRRLAAKAFAHTALYDQAIASYLTKAAEVDREAGAGAGAGVAAAGTAGGDAGAQAASGAMSALPPRLDVCWRLTRLLRYGENPHQQAGLYLDPAAPAEASVAGAQVLQGKELSYNNLLDLDAALQLIKELALPSAAIIKHNNPCGVAQSPDGVGHAYELARETDPVSAFGGIVAVNREVDVSLAAKLAETFLEAVIAPGFSEEARALLGRKKNLRLLVCGPMEGGSYRDRGVLVDAGGATDGRAGLGAAAGGVTSSLQLRSLVGGLLVQGRDLSQGDLRSARLATRRAPTAEERETLELAWAVCKHTRSNAIVLCQPGRTVGIGAGQMSRVDSVRIAVIKANLPTQGSVLASDAFFPFRDGIDQAAAAGVRAVVQPGGSLRDAEVIAAADEHGMAMLLTGVRHFRH
jgi:phosphoribosylaminoimidazolecarboxamide formyltransferase/IMP cyclohydrolase